jgi:hypothetical protein
MHQRAQQRVVLAQPSAHNIALPPERAKRVSQGGDFCHGGGTLARHERGLSKTAAVSFTIFNPERNLPNRKWRERLSQRLVHSLAQSLSQRLAHWLVQTLSLISSAGCGSGLRDYNRPRNASAFGSNSVMQ